MQSRCFIKCRFCQHGRLIRHADLILCPEQGEVDLDHSCDLFKKRIKTQLPKLKKEPAARIIQRPGD